MPEHLSEGSLWMCCVSWGLNSLLEELMALIEEHHLESRQFLLRILQSYISCAGEVGVFAKFFQIDWRLYRRL